MKFVKWREKMARSYKASSDSWLVVATFGAVIDVINFLCIIGNIELQMSFRIFLLQVVLFGICTGVVFTCLAVSKANDYKAVKIMESDGKNETQL